MSGKGGNNNASAKPNAGSGGRTSTAAPPEPTIVSGWEYHRYAQSSPDRYVYIGKDEDGEPEFMDYGPKSSRR